ncbi:MAG: hypothetical protein AMS27_02480 [Bacteroides sp. SM23_62_1]|nr:MAG: hypothetical protein AMS27_02480 [Bacteroides sp. SM23_62_1]
MSRNLLIAFLLSLIQLPILSQDTDFELWLAAQVRKDFGKKFRLYFEQGYRRDEFLVHTKTIYFEGGGYFKPVKFLWLGSYYRYATDFKGFRKNRVSGEVLLRGELDRFGIKLRSQYNSEFAEDIDTDHYLREKISIDYNIRNCKIDPFIASEAIFHLQTDQSENEQIRFDIGVEWKIGKRNSIDFFYRYRDKRNVKNPLHSHIIGIDYVFEF